MRKLLVMLLFALLPLHAAAGDFERDFAVVFIDATTEAKYGRIPLDRALLAEALEKAASAGAKGGVVKFFLDLPRSENGDRRLAAVMAHFPVALQARMDDGEKNPNELADRFVVSGLPVETSVEGKSGWIPLPVFTEHARDVGFVDFGAPPVPLFEKYRHRTMKSLLLCAVEMADGHSASVVPGKYVTLRGRRIALDALNRFDIDLDDDRPIKALAFHDLIEGKIPAEALKNKVVILAYDGPNIHTIKSANGEVGAHRMFVLVLRAFYEQL